VLIEYLKIYEPVYLEKLAMVMTELTRLDVNAPIYKIRKHNLNRILLLILCYAKLKKNPGFLGPEVDDKYLEDYIEFYGV
jgi:hypothetical protein